MIQFLTAATFAVFIPLSSASGATFSYDAYATLTLTSVTGAPDDFVISEIGSAVGGATDNFGGVADKTGAVAVSELGFSAEISGSGASGLSSGGPFQPSFAFSTANASPAFAISSNGRSPITANFTFSFGHQIATSAALLSETSSLQSIVKLTQFRNGVSTELVSDELVVSRLLLNSGFAPDTALGEAEDQGTIDFSVLLPQSDIQQFLGLQLFIAAEGVARTFAEATPAPTPIPLPPSAALFASGLGALMLVRRREKMVKAGH